MSDQALSSHNGSSPQGRRLGHFRTPGTPQSLPLIRQSVVDAATQCGLGDEDIAKMEMAVGEACTNIIEHSYSTHPQNLDIEIHIQQYQDRFEVVILDFSSINFAVDAAVQVGLDDYIATQRRRGLGLYIIQTFVDKVEHRFICGQGNELRLTKFLH